MANTTTIRSLRLHQLAGLSLMLLLFAGIGGWAAFASISGAVIAEARIVVETNPKKLQHPEGGVVSEILVTDGARVEAGQLLLRLDETETRANLAIINTMLDELIARQARLEAERDGKDDFRIPEALAAGRLDRATLTSAVVGQRALFVARRTAKQGEQEQLRYKIEQLGEAISGLEAQRASKERPLSLITSELTAVQGLKDKGLVRLNRLLGLERELARLEGERGSLIAQIAGKRGEISETHLRIIQIDKNRSSEIVTELRDAQTKIAELTEKRLAAEIRLQRAFTSSSWMKKSTSARFATAGSMELSAANSQQIAWARWPSSAGRSLPERVATSSRIAPVSKIGGRPSSSIAGTWPKGWDFR
jgi:HlyD family secretion protein